jgi:hypothetical protein
MCISSHLQLKTGAIAGAYRGVWRVTNLLKAGQGQVCTESATKENDANHCCNQNWD